MSRSRASLLQLLRLCSPALPVGAFSYSRGLEFAALCGHVHDEPSARAWILGLLRHATARLDAPVMLRLYDAFHTHDTAAVERWAAFVLACRESAEIVREEANMGEALARLLVALGEPRAAPFVTHPARSMTVAFALAADHFGIPAEDAVTGYLWLGVEAQVSAAVRLVPLGQTSAQRILSAAIEAVDMLVPLVLTLADDDLGATAPGLSLASMRHETQYSRLFRS